MQNARKRAAFRINGAGSASFLLAPGNAVRVRRERKSAAKSEAPPKAQIRARFRFLSPLTQKTPRRGGFHVPRRGDVVPRRFALFPLRFHDGLEYRAGGGGQALEGVLKLVERNYVRHVYFGVDDFVRDERYRALELFARA